MLCKINFFSPPPILQVSHHQGHHPALQGYSPGAGGGPHQTGGQGGHQVQLQALTAGSEDRGEILSNSKLVINPDRDTYAYMCVQVRLP